jgi:ribosomal protein L2
LRKVAISKVQKGATHPHGGGTSASDVVEEEQGTPEGATGDRLSQTQGRASPAMLVRSLPTAVPLKTSFSVCRSEM